MDEKIVDREQKVLTKLGRKRRKKIYDTRFPVSINRELLEKFLDACQHRGESGSVIIRRMIRRFIRETREYEEV